MPDLAQLPDDVSTLKQAVLERERRLSEFEARAVQDAQRIARLEHHVAVLERMVFGPRSEKRAAAADLHTQQGRLLFPEILEMAQRVADSTGATGSIELQAPRQPRPRRGRRSEFPEHLPVVRTRYELPEEKRQCCGQTMAEMGEQVTRELERLEVTVVHEIARKKYACRKCQEHIELAPGPTRVIEKGLLGSGFLAQVLVERFGQHMPYHRLEKKYQAEGLSLSRAVLCTSAKAAAELYEPVWQALGAEVRASPVVHTDATNVVVAQSDYGGRGRGQVWVYADHDDRLWYDFTDGHSRDGPTVVLEKYRGYLQADAAPEYDALYHAEGATEVACMAHCRRYFVKAADSDPTLSAEALRRIGELYAVEKLAREQELDADGIRALRQAQARPLLVAWADWLEVTKGQVLDQSPMGQAIRYAQAQWQALVRYTEDGRLEIDNNRAERGLRAVVCGRKNWMTLGNEGGGRTAAILYSLVQTCKAAGIDARTYLRDALIRLREGVDPSELTPHRWKEKFAAEVQATRDWVLAQIRGQAR